MRAAVGRHCLAERAFGVGGSPGGGLRCTARLLYRAVCWGGAASGALRSEGRGPIQPGSGPSARRRAHRRGVGGTRGETPALLGRTLPGGGRLCSRRRPPLRRGGGGRSPPRAGILACPPGGLHADGGTRRLEACATRGSLRHAGPHPAAVAYAPAAYLPEGRGGERRLCSPATIHGFLQPASRAVICTPPAAAVLDPPLLPVLPSSQPSVGGLPYATLRTLRL